ncbi:MAG: LamG-like jellyroll fold domain-containing protein [Phycisphaerales bacterium]
MGCRIALVCAVLAVVGSSLAYGQSAYFDQPTDTIQLTGNTVLGQTSTIEAYVYATVLTPVDEGRLYAEQQDALEDKWLAANGSTTSGGHWNNACDASRAQSGPTSPAAWHHIAFMRDTNTYNLFVDGVRVDQRPATCPGGNSSGSRMSIGAFHYIFANTLHESFIGYVDWLRVSSTARYPVSGFVAPTTEPAADAGTLVLMTFNDPPGTINPAVQGSGVSAAVVATGFAGATSPQFGVSPCDSIDFNQDGLFPDTADIEDFLSVFAGGPCSTGTCGDTDFNNDGLFPDTLDIDALLSVFSGGPCL